LKSNYTQIFILLLLIFLIILVTITSIIISQIYYRKNNSTAYVDKISSKDIITSEYIENNTNNDTAYINSTSKEEQTIIKETNKPSKLLTSKAKYYIRVNYSANVVNIYTKDSNGNYTVPYKAMICSCGSATPQSGTYEISSKYRWLSLFGNVNGQYSTRIVNHILFHSVPYLEKSPDSLEYWEYDKLGTTASAGCIRLKVEDAKWIYDNCTSGTKVEFYSDINPGPLGKPSIIPISSNKSCRNWDPTDLNKNNPWNK